MVLPQETGRGAELGLLCDFRLVANTSGIETLTPQEKN